MCLVIHLVGSHFSVSGAKRNAQFETLFLDLLHAGQGGGGEVGRRHVVVAYFLVTRRHFAHDGTAGHLEIHTLEKIDKIVERAEEGAEG